MINTARRSSIPPAVWIGILAVGATAIFVAAWPIHRVLGQVYAMVAILIAFACWPPLRHLVAQMPNAHRTVFLLMVASIVIGHFTLNSRRYFPFVAWEIFPFAVHTDPVEVHAFVGTTSQGRQVRLLPEQLFPSVTQFDLPRPDQSELNEPLAQALAAAYNRQHATDPVRHIDLLLFSQPLHSRADQPRSAPSCELLEHYDVSSAPSN